MTREEMLKIVHHQKVLQSMGCAVVVFTPEELRGANPDHVEDRLIETAWNVIEVLATEEEAA
jgi:hypothetical protein